MARFTAIAYELPGYEPLRKKEHHPRVLSGIVRVEKELKGELLREFHGQVERLLQRVKNDL
jgi:hypothetical protein